MKRTAVVVLAAGSGSRFGHSTNKVWLPLSGRRIISRSLVNAAKPFNKARLVLVIHPDDEAMAKEVLAREVPQLKVEIVYGGATRHESEYQALIHLRSGIDSGEIDVVLIHDGARPLATPTLFKEIATEAVTHGGAIPTITVEPIEMDIKQNVPVVRVQTPQGFIAKELLSAYLKAAEDSFTGTDTGACIERYFPSIKTHSVTGEPTNVKITYPQDLAIAEHVLAKRGYKD
ncbi:MAG: 2-C-methyl-D-erythritol 4-phosphate cytidylyltransferase [Candidatus Nanopelagicaceae bacterium]